MITSSPTVSIAAHRAALSAKDEIIEGLKARVQALEGTLGVGPADDLAVAFRLPKNQSRILELLLKASNVTPEMFRVRLGITTDLRIPIYRLRRDLKPDHIEIRSRRTLGYWIDSDTKARIKQLVAERTTSKVTAAPLVPAMEAVC